MSSSLLADVIMVLHAGLILAVFVGIGASVRYKRYRPVEAVVLLAAVTIWSIYGACPLTAIEHYFRNLAGSPRPLMELGFIPYYAGRWLNLSVSPGQVEWATYAIAVIFVLLSIDWEYSYFRSRKTK